MHGEEVMDVRNTTVYSVCNMSRAARAVVQRRVRGANRKLTRLNLTRTASYLAFVLSCPSGTGRGLLWRDDDVRAPSDETLARKNP